MEIVTKKINTANAIASGAIALKNLEEKMAKVAMRLSKTIKMDGFRKGKVPLSLVRARYADGIKQDAQKEAVQDMLQAALKKLEIEANQVIGDPVITKFEQKGEDIDVEIKISLTPTIKLDKVESCVPEVKLAAISPKQVDERLQEIAKRQAPLISAPKAKKLENDDVAVFDFEGFVDGKAFDGGKAEKFELTIGSKQFIAGFEDAMLGMSAGENKEIKVTFPKDYQAKHLAGKEALFKIKLHEIKIKDKVVLNDDLAKTLMPNSDKPTLANLKEEISKQLELEAKTKLYNEELKEKLVENFAKNIDFDLPDLIIEQEMDVLFRNALNTFEESELEAMRKDASKAKEKRESFRADAQKNVKVTFIVDALAKEHGISVHDNEVYQTIYYEAMMMGQNPQDALEYYKNNNLFPAIKMAMIEDRILTYLLDKKLANQENKTEKQDSPKSKKTEDAKKEAQSAAKKSTSSKSKDDK